MRLCVNCKFSNEVKEEIIEDECQDFFIVNRGPQSWYECRHEKSARQEHINPVTGKKSYKTNNGWNRVTQNKYKSCFEVNKDGTCVLFRDKDFSEDWNAELRGLSRYKLSPMQLSLDLYQ